MRTILLFISLLITLTVKSQSESNNGYPYTQVPFTAVKLAPESFWGQRIKAAREVTIPLAFSKCESEGRYKNFQMAAYTLQHPGHAGLQTDEWDVSKFMGFSFDDTDVYKTIEGASYVLQTYPDKQLEAYIDSILDIVAAAQEPDGYLYTARTINPQKPHGWSGSKRWEKDEELSHELYNLGHMVDAACAHYQATGSRKFLDIAMKFADCVVREVGPRADQACVVPGHQIAEMALARLYVLTGEKKYLDEAKFFLDYRGKTNHHDIYNQSHQPVVEQKEAWGHAVRAGYMYAGMADVAALTGDEGYIQAIDAIWKNIVERKYYLTGGVGARHSGEAFGADYELPNMTAYNETCAAIAQVYLNHRMFLLHGDAKYIDCLERTLYNGVISGMSVDGGKFFYPNPLCSDGVYKFNSEGTTTRQDWFGCACCPSNLCRFIPSVPGYIYAVKDKNLYVNLFTANTATLQIGGRDVTLEETTEYPWDGDIALRITQNRASDFTLMVRIPGWVRGNVVPSDLYQYADGKPLSYTISVNGETLTTPVNAQGYVPISRKWKKGDVVRIHFDMQPRTVIANQKVTDDRGRVAVERGPLVYCAEGIENGGLNTRSMLMPAQPQFTVAPQAPILNTEGDGNTFYVTKLTTNVEEVALDAQGKINAHERQLTLIPYYAWNHRGAGNMDVWLAQSLRALSE